MGSQKELDKYIKDKSVIFVGPSRIMEGRGLGEWIDSFDIVVRTNGAGLLLDKSDYQKDYGKRCNILYMNGQFMRQADNYNIDVIMNYGLKFIVLKTFRPEYLDEYVSNVHVLGIGNRPEGLKKSFMGNLIISHLLQYKPEKLWITGVDFYNQKDRYFPGYTPPTIEQVNAKKRAETVKSHMEKYKGENRGKIHNGHANHLYTYNLIQKGTIETNDFVLEQLEEKLWRLSNGYKW